MMAELDSRAYHVFIQVFLDERMSSSGLKQRECNADSFSVSVKGDL